MNYSEISFGLTIGAFSSTVTAFISALQKNLVKAP